MLSLATFAMPAPLATEKRDIAARLFEFGSGRVKLTVQNPLPLERRR